MDIGEADRRVVLAVRLQELGHAPVGRRGGKPGHDGHRADDRAGVEQPLHRRPQQHARDGHEADGVEEICRAHEVARHALRQHESQIEKDDGHLVGEIMDGVHDQAET